MATLTKAKVAYSAKIKRQSTLPPISTDRSGLKAQEIPPELCHLTGDALATPFPPIALGGYIKYYRAHPGHVQSAKLELWTREHAKHNLNVPESPRDAKKRRRASSASVLLSQTPKRSPSNEHPLDPPKFHLFHLRTSSSPESTPSPASPAPPLPSPRSRRRHFLSIIPEASRETMRPEAPAESLSLPTGPRKSRVISYPVTGPVFAKPSLTTSAPALSLNTSPLTTERASSLTKPSSSQSSSTRPLSSSGSLRRKKRQILRTPSVENDFARSARELLGFGRKEIGAGVMSRQDSSGSEATEEDSSLSPTISVSTALTSILDSVSQPPSPSSATKHDENHQPLNPNSSQDSSRAKAVSSDHVNSTTPPRTSLESDHKRNSSTKSEDSLGSDTNSSPTVSTPPTSFTGGGGLLDDAELRRFVVLQLMDDDEDGNRDSWASFATAKSCSEPSLPVVVEGDDSSTNDNRRKNGLAVVTTRV